MKFLIILLSIFFSFNNIYAAESSIKNMPKHEWTFNGITGYFDKASVQRGFKVYREVCAGCHSMKLLYYRDLIDIGFSKEQVKAIAAEYTVIDGPNDEGEMFERNAIPSDRFVSPFANDQEARINNNGSYPPDLSVITKARKYGPDYIYNLLIGYKDAPGDFEMSEGMYYNEWYEGHQIAMAAPLDDEYVDYDDGTINSLEQLSKDVVNFLVWSAEPELEERKNIGLKVIIFFIVIGLLFYLIKLRLWRNIY